MAHKHGVLFHTDAVQSFGKITVDVEDMNVDLLSISGHKIYGPKGIGALYIRQGTPIEAMIYGGGHERNLRAGTQNVPAIVGFGKAVEICENVMEEEAARLTELRDKLWNDIQASIEGVRLNGHPTERVPGILNISFAGVDAESILISLDMKGIAVSSGSACQSGSTRPSHVLEAIGLPPELLRSALRFSLGRSNAEEDIAYTVEALKEVIERLRAMSATA